MTARVAFNDFGRWQLRGAVEKLRRVDPQVAREFLNEVGTLLRSPKKLLAREAPIDGFPEFPSREVRVGGYRVFIRRTEDATWVVGVWPTQRESST
jgi:hypothetical protein